MQQKCNSQCSKCRQWEQDVTEMFIQWHPILSQYVIGQYDSIECTLTVCDLHDVSKHLNNYHDAVNKIKIRLKSWYHAIPASRWNVERINKSSPVFYCLKNSRSHGRQSDSPCWCRRRRTVGADTWCLINSPISRLKAHHLAVRSVKSMQAGCLSSQLCLVA